MHSFACKLTAASLALISAVAAMPTEPRPEPLDLSVVMNKTTCPIVVHIDEDKQRIPQRIKMLKCGSDPQEQCRARVPDYECCGRRRDGVRMACVEVLDAVQVLYPAAAHHQRQTYTVSVGCACVMEPDPSLHEPTP